MMPVGPIGSVHFRHVSPYLEYDLKTILDLSRQPRRCQTRHFTHANVKITQDLREMQIEMQRQFLALLLPRILAIIASTEKIPGPKSRTIIAVSMNRNGAAVTNASGLSKMCWTLSESAVR
jgi:hypothetical protein